MIAAVLLPIGAWLAGGRRPGRPPRSAAPAGERPSPQRRPALLVGVVGGISGIGGGSLPGTGAGRASASALAEVAPAALASTFLTSIVGVVTYAVLSLRHSGSIAPDWGVGLAMGAGGLLGGYVGSGLQSRLPEPFLRRGARRPRPGARRALRR